MINKEESMPRGVSHSFVERKEKGYKIKSPSRTKKFGRPAL